MTTRSVLFDKAEEPRSVEVDDDLASSLKSSQLLWVDVRGASDEADPLLTELGVPPILRPRRAGRDDPKTERPSLFREQGWIRLAVTAIQAPAAEAPVADPIATTQLDVLAGKNIVVTIHAEPLDAIGAIEEQFRDEPGLGVLDAAALVAGIVDEVLANYLRHVEVIERRIDVLDELAIRGRSAKAYLGEVVALRRRIALLRRSLAPHREAFGPLARPDFEIAALGRPWPGLVDRLEATLAAIQNVRELLIGSVALQQSGTAERVNDVMKRLTIVNAVLLPAVVLAGVMGMNFPMPFFSNTGFFWVVVGAMATLAITILGVARLRGWL